ncbi:MAG: class I SAM-dependent methyltransferase [Candidatus Heimdallarchaeota archaeon]|nr:class I SAM-dependent methyltransferase [Candidatus Heimdallarchaeota archaeon]
MTVDVDKSTLTDLTEIDVERYYEEQSIVYNFSSKNSFHYGIWDSKTSNSQQAQENLNRMYGSKLDLNNDDIVLDAGCGIGGPAVFMAENYGVDIIGITISGSQVHHARKLASNSKNKANIQFLQQDYNKTTFKDEHFSKIYAMESSCHAVDKSIFLKEMYRLLKKGGKFMVTDGFMIKRNLNLKDKKDVEISVKGMCLPSLFYFDDFEQELENAGFTVLEKFDLMKESDISIRNAWINALLAYPITKILSVLNWIPPRFHDTILMGLAQRKLAKKKIAILGGFLAEK